MEEHTEGTQASSSGVSSLPSEVSDADECSAVGRRGARTPHAEHATAVASSRKGKGKKKVAQKVEPVRGKTRRRRHDGAIVPKSTISYHLFKISKKALRKRKLAPAQHRDDDPVFVPKHALDFVQMRHYVASTLVDFLLKSEVLDTEGCNMVRFEIESAHEALLQNAQAYANSRFGSVVQWVLLLAQQAKALQNSGDWLMDTPGDMEKWNLCRLFGTLQAGTNLRLTPLTASVSESAATLSSLLQQSFGSASAAKFVVNLRKRLPRGDWIHSEIAAGNPPEKKVQLLVK